MSAQKWDVWTNLLIQPTDADLQRFAYPTWMDRKKAYRFIQMKKLQRAAMIGWCQHNGIWFMAGRDPANGRDVLLHFDDPNGFVPFRLKFWPDGF